LFFSCGKEPWPVSNPVIAYKDFIRWGNQANPDSAAVVISFSDNEGDIDNGSVFMEYFYDSAGYWAAYDMNPGPAFDTLKFFYRLPHINFKPHEPALMQGIIYAKQYPFISPYQKIKYKVYMYDHAMNRSNTIETSVIQL
jgi:hypothetical protein